MYLIQTWFRQYGDTLHFANVIIDLWRQKFPGRIIFRNCYVNWSPRWCDLKPNYFLSEYWKIQVYLNNPRTFPEQMDEIIHDISWIEPRLCQNFYRRMGKEMTCGRYYLSCINVITNNSFGNKKFQRMNLNQICTSFILGKERAYLF